jgi:hypothetical protein
METFIPQPLSAFLVGASIIAFAQIARYRHMIVRSEGMEDWIALLGTLRTRDFAGPGAYFAGATIYVVASLIVYLMLCLVPSETLHGALRILGISTGADEETVLPAADSQFPIYVAAIFLGASSVLGERAAKFIDAMTGFFQNRISVPNRVLTASREIGLIFRKEAKASPDGERMLALIKTIAGGDWQRDVDAFADGEFAFARISRIWAAAGGNVDDLSKSEAARMLDSFVKLLIISSARRTGMRGVGLMTRYVLVEIAGLTDESLPVYPPQSDLSPFISSILVFSFFGFVIFMLLNKLDGPASLVFGTDLVRDGWPTPGTWLGRQLLYVIAPFLFVFCVCAASWHKGLVRAPGEPVSLWNIRENLPRYATVLMACVVGSFVIIWLVNLSAASLKEGVQANTVSDVGAKSVAYFVQAFVPLGFAYGLLAFFESEAGRVKPASLVSLAVFVAAASTLFSGIYAAFFVDYFADSGLGSEFVAFAVAVNLLVSTSLFLSVWLFLYLDKRPPQRQPAPAAAALQVVARRV